VGRLAFGPEDGRLRGWVEARRQQLLDYEMDALLGALAQLGAQHEAAREKAEDLMGYYEHNRSRMDFPRYRRMGLQIGSSPVESACNQIVTQRLKGAGMRWLEAGAQTIARLRCILLSGEWTAFRQHWNRTAPAAAI